MYVANMPDYEIITKSPIADKNEFHVKQKTGRSRDAKSLYT